MSHHLYSYKLSEQKEYDGWDVKWILEVAILQKVYLTQSSCYIAHFPMYPNESKLWLLYKQWSLHQSYTLQKLTDCLIDHKIAKNI